MPNFESSLTLLSKVAMDKEEGNIKFISLKLMQN